jgi:hypothetical protein
MDPCKDSVVFGLFQEDVLDETSQTKAGDFHVFGASEVR